MSLILQALRKSEKEKNTKILEDKKAGFWESGLIQYTKNNTKLWITLAVIGFIIIIILFTGGLGYLFISQRALLNEIKSSSVADNDGSNTGGVNGGGIDTSNIAPLVPIPEPTATEKIVVVAPTPIIIVVTATPVPAFTPTPTVSAPDPSGILKVSGVIWDPQRPMAIVNSVLVEVGDSVDGYTVESIQKDSINVKGWSQSISVAR
jgi:hypothetical protein